MKRQPKPIATRLAQDACRVPYGTSIYIFERRNGHVLASWMPEGPGPDNPLPLAKVPLPVRRVAYAWFDGGQS